MTAPRFTSTAFLIWGGLLTWAAYFLFVYVFAALACARRFAHLSIAGVPIVTLVTGIAALVALGATVALTRRAARRLDQPAGIARFLAIALGSLAVICILWVALPPLLLRRTC